MFRNKFNLSINLPKILFFISLMYTEIIAVKYWSIPYLSVALFTLTAIVTIVQYQPIFYDVTRDNKIFSIFFLFVFVTLLTSLLTASDFQVSLKVSINLSQSWLSLVVMCVLARADQSMKYLSKVFLFMLLAIGAILIFDPVDFSDGVGSTRYATIAAIVNPHSIGATAVLGVWLVFGLLIDNRKTVRRVILSTALIVFLFFIMFLTNSRKSVVCGVILLVLLFAPFLRHLRRTMSLGQRLTVTIVLLTGFCFLIQYVVGTDLLTSNNFLYRITEGMTGDSNIGRINMILKGFEIFLDNPFFGVGLNNVRYHMGDSLRATYTHCTYSELLASCGLVGSALFGLLVYRLCLTARRADRKLRTTGFRNYHTSLLIVCFVLGWMQIFFYEDHLMYMLSFVYVSSYTKNLQNQSLL